MLGVVLEFLFIASVPDCAEGIAFGSDEDVLSAGPLSLAVMLLLLLLFIASVPDRAGGMAFGSEEDVLSAGPESLMEEAVVPFECCCMTFLKLSTPFAFGSNH